MKKPKAPAEDASTIALREQQVLDLSKLDEDENTRIKQLLVGQRGGRFFRGSPLLRARPSNSAGGTGLGGPNSTGVSGAAGSSDYVADYSAQRGQAFANARKAGQVIGLY